MILERREAQVLADRQARLWLVAMGAEVDVPDVADAKARLDDWLAAPLKTVRSPEEEDRAALLEALGVKRAS